MRIGGCYARCSRTGSTLAIRNAGAITLAKPILTRSYPKAGMNLLAEEPALASWLCEPAQALGGKVPLQVMRSAKGRKDVAVILRRIDYGVY